MRNALSPQKTVRALAAIVALSGLTTEHAVAFVQTDLVSDVSGLATITDPLLENPWGVSLSPVGSPFWTSNQGNSTATLYAVTNGTSVSRVTGVNANGFVGIPTTAGGPQGPTGQVNNTNTASFQLGGGPSTSARFIFANLNGTISGWAGGLTSTIVATTPGAVYTGLAINTAGNRLYAADDNSGGTIHVFDSSFAPVNLPGAFVDPNLPAGLVPFNVRDIGGKVYVTYSVSGRGNQIAATSSGIVDVFDENGAFQTRLATGGVLASPWGLALAPTGFEQFGGDLLVGNFSFVDSTINAFDPTTGAFEGSIPINVGLGNTAGGLWSLQFGSGAGSGGDANTLYFTDGIDGETHGLFGAIQAPEPSSMALLALGVAVLGARRARRSGKSA